MSKALIKYWELHKIPILISILSILFYGIFAYNLHRTEFIKLVLLFVALFYSCYKLIQFKKWNPKFLLAIGILFRLVFIIATPNLSQDFYRFIWDGELVSHGINPYLQIPNVLIEQKDIIVANAQELYLGMGSLSPKHFSNYPPLNQFLFAIAALLSGKTIFGAITVMRIFIILADIGILYFGSKLLKNLNRPPHLIFWYFLNPLIIIELTGNLHFEGVMLFFFIWSLYLVSKNKWKLGAVIYALSICIKLVPLLFLPLFLNHFKFKKAALFYIIVGVTCTILLLPFFSSEFITNYSATVGLWFSNFEFNAGIYNFIKQVAILFDAKPWELIKTYGKITPILTIIIVFLFTFLRNNRKTTTLITSMLWVLSCYYFLSATVHPWYIAFIILLTVFTKFRFSLVWSFAVVLSYYAYSRVDFQENLWLLTIEYLLVFGYLGYEIFTLHNKNKLFCKN